MNKAKMDTSGIVAAPKPSSDSGWRWSQLSSLSKGALLFLVLSQIPLLLLILNRTFVEFDVDSGEYFLMHVIERVRTGAPIYVPTAPGQCAPNYPPLYFWVSGWLCRLFGSSMAWPRLVSVVSSLTFASLTGWFVWKRTEKNIVLSVAAACFLLSSCAYVGPWVFDIQVNAMQGALSLLGFAVLMGGFTLRRVVSSAVILSLAVLTKHTALAYLVAAGVLIFLQAPRLAVVYAAISVGLLALVCTWLNITSHGYFLLNVMGAGDAPWLIQRLWTEVLFPDLLGRYGLMAALLLIPVFALPNIREVFALVLKPEYVLCAAGIAVACIAQPKYGSGPTQALVGYAGLSICGTIALYQLGRMLSRSLAELFSLWIVVLQIVILLLSGVTTYSSLFIDDDDRAMYQQITEVFKRGRAAFFYFPFLPTLFGQPEAGQYGDETMKWKNGRADYSSTPPSIYEPFVREEYDYVILPVFADQRDPSVQAILAHYKAVSKLPGHPRGVIGGNFRYEKVVFEANRLHPELSTGSSTPQVKVGPLMP